MTTFEAVREVLVGQFKVDAARAVPDATLESLGLDSLALMEFVFAVEDRFAVRIPEDRLDPRQAGTTLGRLADLIDEAVATGATATAGVAPAAPVAAATPGAAAASTSATSAPAAPRATDAAPSPFAPPSPPPAAGDPAA